MAGLTRITATNARSVAASRALVADGERKTQSRLLPSAARLRSLRSGSIPAVSLPALHFSARRTADRSSSSFFTMKPSDGNFQTFGYGGDLVIHQITLPPLNPGNCSLIENNTPGSQPPRQIVLRNWRFIFQPRLANAAANDISSGKLMGFFQNM